MQRHGSRSTAVNLPVETFSEGSHVERVTRWSHFSHSDVADEQVTLHVSVEAHHCHSTLYGFCHCLLHVYAYVWPWGRRGTARVPIQSMNPLMKVADSKINLPKTLVSLHRPDYIHPLFLPSHLHTHTFIFGPILPPLAPVPSSSPSFFSCFTLFIPHCTAVGHGRGISQVGGGCLSW